MTRKAIYLISAVGTAVVLAVCLFAFRGPSSSAGRDLPGAADRGPAVTTAGCGDSSGTDWCKGHGVPESACTRCNPELIAGFKARGDWCAGHNLPESQCVACNPPGAKKGSGCGGGAGGDSQASQPAADWCKGHGVPESACTRCNPKLIAGFKARGDWCAGHNLPESQCVACNPQLAKTGPGSGAAAGGPAVSTDFSELEKVSCEHKPRKVDCDKCRFECGVVKIAESIGKTLVKTDRVALRKTPGLLEANGEVRLDATRVVDVTATGCGRVLDVKAVLGQEVKAGDLLAVIHSSDLGEAKAAYLGAHTKSEIAGKEYQRQTAVSQALTGLIERLTKGEKD
ncbi:MAG: efflux RND transporter periplasmic adaptor subunit, partial [Planctomycetota bacterium]